MQISKEERRSFTVLTTGEVYRFSGGIEVLFYR